MKRMNNKSISVFFALVGTISLFGSCVFEGISNILLCIAMISVLVAISPFIYQICK